MKKIDWYIIRKFLSSFGLTLGLFTVIIIVFDVSEKIDEFVENDVSLGEIVFDYYFNFVPFLLNLFSPVFVFISVIFFTSKLASRSEIVSLLASGTSYIRLLVPYVAVATLIAVFSYVLNGWIIPHADKERLEFENTYIRNLENNYTTNVRSQILPGVVMSLQSYNYLDSVGNRISLEHYENGRMISRTTGKKLRWNYEADKWRIVDYNQRIFKEGNLEEIRKGEYLDTMIDFNPEDFFRKPEDVYAFNMQELDDYIALQEMKGMPNMFFYITEKYRRVGSPFSIIILTLIGVCVSSIKSRGGIGWNLAKGILISFAFIFIMQFFTSLVPMDLFIRLWRFGFLILPF
jgi:lipopolysaccharide export system permease protein